MASPRIARRREQARARILDVASRRFAAGGLEGARLDEIADEADVARGTLYSHFSTKEELLCAILEPVLVHACKGVRALRQAGPSRAVDGLLALYLELWHCYPDALRVTNHAKAQPLGGLERLHGEFITGVLAIFEKARRARRLRAQEPALSARVLSQVAVPLLELYGGHPRAEQLWAESMKGLLLEEGRARPAPKGCRR